MKYLKQVLSLVAVAALGVAVLGMTSADFDMTSTETTTADKIEVQGHLVDTKCYGMGVNMDKPKMNYHNKHMVKGKDGKMKEVPNCATACANMGIPVGIVEGSEPGNKTYVLVTPAGQLANHMDKEARVEGQTAFDGGIIPSKIEVKEDGEWKEISIQTMM